MANELEEAGADPGEHDAPRHAPAPRREPARCADTHDGSRDGVRRADWNAEMSGAHQCQGPSRLRRKSAKGRELGDALTHSFDDAPSTRHRPAAHGQVAAN